MDCQLLVSVEIGRTITALEPISRGWVSGFHFDIVDDGRMICSAVLNELSFVVENFCAYFTIVRFDDHIIDQHSIVNLEHVNTKTFLISKLSIAQSAANELDVNNVVLILHVASVTFLRGEAFLTFPATHTTEASFSCVRQSWNKFGCY